VSVAGRGEALAPSTRVLIGVGMALHAVLAVTLGLSPDEAHYALYGARPDWSYFDHPPLVGWLQAVFVQAGGSDFAMRIVPMACWLLTALCAIAACRRLPLAVATPMTTSASRREAARRDDWAVALLLVSPLLDLLGVALVPDSLLMPLVLAAMLATWRLRDPAVAGRVVAWLPLAAVLGLSVLSKYTAVFVLAGALAGLARFHRGRLLRLPGFWATAGLTVLAAGPVLYWNVVHHWVSIAYQAGHAAGSHRWTATNVARALLVQVPAYGVLLPLAAVREWRRGAAGGRDRASDASIASGDARWLVAVFALPVLVTAMALAGRGTSLPHWTAVGWTALLPMAAAGAARLSRGWARGLVAGQAAFLCAGLALLWSGGVGVEAGADAGTPPGAVGRARVPNAVADLYGWDTAAVHAADLARRRGVSSLSVTNWSLASRIAWYARPWPVHVVHDRGDQFSLWFGVLAPGESTILVDSSQMSFAPELGGAGFVRCSPIDQTQVVRAGRQIAHFTYALCEGWGGEVPGAGRGGASP
jgi:hypothetical protein